MHSTMMDLKAERRQQKGGSLKAGRLEISISPMRLEQEKDRQPKK